MPATEGRAIGYGGVTQVSRACGLSRKAIAKGTGEITEKAALSPGRVRRLGAGSKEITVCEEGRGVGV
jgi:hypothetical protein